MTRAVTMSTLLLGFLLSAGTLLALPTHVFAIGTVEGTGIVIAGEDRLTESGRRTLRALLTQMSPALYQHLQVVRVDSTPIPPDMATTPCVLAQTSGPCWVNIWSGNEGERENPFPSDAPVTATSSGFYVVAAHEIGHNISFYAYKVRGGRWWEERLVAEAGCEPKHYLRSMFAPCFFHDYPQEFTASMLNQWATCSECTLRLALARWDAGITHPLNQFVYLAWLFGLHPDGDVERQAGQILSYRERNGLPETTIWTSRPFQCGGNVTVAAPTWTLTLTLDDVCRVIAVAARDGM